MILANGEVWIQIELINCNVLSKKAINKAQVVCAGLIKHN